MVDVLGTRLGRYEIRERLGIGGMAVVYKAWDTNLDRWVAVKVLHDHLAAETDFKARFEREAKVVASLNHPNIVQIYDFDVTEISGVPVYYMVMTYITGRSLKGIMDERHAAGQHLGMPEVLNVLRGICNALSYAHKQGMVHRDVTPGNILFNEQGQAVLADFGIARLLSAARLTQTGMTAGTPMYMSPEQGMGDAGDHRADIYSLGVILFEMLSGMAPYTGDSTFAIVMKHINEPVPPLIKEESMDGVVNESMQNVVLRAMAKVPEDRYGDALDMLEDFERAVGGEKITAVGASPSRTVILGPTKTEAAPAGKATPAGSGEATVMGQSQRRAFTIPVWAAAAGAVVLVIVLLAAILLRPTPTITQPPGGGGDNSELAPPPTREKQFAESMTQGPLSFEDKFGPDRGELIWPILTNDSKVYQNIEPGVGYHIRHTLFSTALPTLFDDAHEYPVNYQYEAEFTIQDDSQSDTAAGIIFRFRPPEGKDPEQYYVFAVNGLGQYSIWVRANNRWTELRRQSVDWTASPAVKPKGQPNRLKLIDMGNHLTAYVNGTEVINIDNDPIILSGVIGIYLASTSSKKVPNPMANLVMTYFSAKEFIPPDATEEATSDPAATSDVVPAATELSPSGGQATEANPATAAPTAAK